MAVSAALNAAQPLSADIATFTPVAYDSIAGFAREDFGDVWPVFLRSCRAIAENDAPQRIGVPPGAALRHLCQLAVAQPTLTSRQAGDFFRQHFQPLRVQPTGPGAEAGLLTGYYEPVVPGSLTRTEAFAAPLWARPDDLVSFAPGERPPGLPADIQAARRLPDGGLAAYPDRAAIEAGGLAGHAQPIAWVRDAVEAFMIHVQGSATLSLPDGSRIPLTYAGRNGRPYTSIGRLLISRGAIAEQEMSLARLKAWVRENGQAEGQAGRALLEENRSFIFFARDTSEERRVGPVGAAGVALTPWRSIAVDRTLWSYGLPFWIEADLPWQGPQTTPFRRLMIAQDTGTAIVGPVRADLFTGSGEAAGIVAGDIRHRGAMIVLVPREGP